MDISRYKISLLIFMMNMSLNCTAQSDNHYVLTKLIDTNAHEGPVYVASQNRLYFTTKPNLVSQSPNTAIHYLTLVDLKVSSFITFANMANGMSLSLDRKGLLVAEQGTKTTLGVIS
ncbi:hypothetical protein [Shewanella surugensis]|uniref:SMP-30/Gluconolactonase/LRE-like region domain-containing protein n=1 Tax=Shewanella surugensis TaxID=212020 RepID=A0ABT0LHH6_9GAMM|nr:hypothetical protein [Shewanella surugensis]MCL1127014.1 hypothetical protein [Shewanella surugensis]